MVSELPLALVDLETTGPSAKHDRIMEVAVVQRGGAAMPAPWESLVNPQCRIPPFIQALTGIDPAALAAAPSFSDIADSLWRALSARVLVAHNARFDLAFLKRELAQCGYDYRPKVLCTLKLARALYPQWPKHGLEAICRYINYHPERHHRALADVLAMAAFLDYALADHGDAVVSYHVALQLQMPALPPFLPREQVDAIPNRPGVYRFYGEGDELLYIGKSVQMRSRVLSHFSADQHHGKAMKLAQQLRRIDWTETPGEMSALLQESREIKQRMPIFNQRLRRQRSLCCVTLDADGEGYEGLRFHKGLPDSALTGKGEFAVFKTAKQAREHMTSAAAEAGLCLRRMGLERGHQGRPCFAHQLKRCRGACCGQEAPGDYNARLRQALDSRVVAAWPHGGPALLREEGDDGAVAWHLVDRWVHIGVLPSETPSLQACERLMQAQSHRQFDYDSYRILKAFEAEWEWLPLSQLQAE